MTIAAKVSSTEIDNILRDRYVDQYFEARLINLPAFVYDPTVAGSDATLLAGEVTLGAGGYTRSVIKYESSDVGNYADGGIPLSQKATVFAHDGTATPIAFSHVALVWSAGNVSTVAAVTSAPVSMADGTYQNIPIDSIAPTGGRGATVNLTVVNGGADIADYTVTVNRPGYGYANGDQATILGSTLEGLDPAVGSGALVFNFGDVHVPDNANQGDLLTVAKTAGTVNLVAGNEAAFYWNLKQFGFYSTAA